MQKTFFQIAGLPRSGSTLFCNILNQNPDIYASPTSGLFQIIKPIVNGWNKIAEFNANATDENKRGLLKGCFEGYYAGRQEKYIFDKCRAWPAELELLQFIFDREPKTIITVRDVRDILSSMEKIYRKEKAMGKAVPGEQENPVSFQTLESRFEFWASSQGLIGYAFNIFLDAIRRGHSKSLYIFEFEKWTHDPSKEFSKLYEWLEIDSYKHDFNNVKQTIKEKDEFYGFSSLHQITEGKVIPSRPIWPEIMSEELSDKYKGSNFWNN